MRVLGCRIVELGLAGALLVFVSGCGANPDSSEPLGWSRQRVSAPLASAYCNIVVTNYGTKPTETDYIPHVITCEDGGANIDALRAQAIAARSVAYYAMATKGSICSGTGCQVYSCGATPSAKAIQAAKDTAGMYLSYGGMLTYGFFVAGDPNTSPPSCHGSGGGTEAYVTYNEGLTGTAVHQTTLGYVGPPGYGQNRGCMSQWGGRCLENNNGYNYKQILQFYYGADIKIIQATGSCVSEPAYGASFVSQSFPLASKALSMTTGQTIPGYIEMKNTGTKTWDSNTRLATTQPRDRSSVFADSTWVAPNRPAAVSGSVAPGQSYKFSFDLHAPNKTGTYYEYFGMVEEGVAWFSDPGQGGPPDKQLEVQIKVVQGSGTGGGAGSPGNGGSAGSPANGGIAGSPAGIAGSPANGGSAGTLGSGAFPGGGATGGGEHSHTLGSNSGGGCGCRTAPARSPGGAAGLFFLAGFWWRRRKGPRARR